MAFEIQQNQLRSEISWLGGLLGKVIVENVGQPALNLVEEIRLLSRDQRNGDLQAAKQLREKLSTLSGDDLRTVIRAFAIFLDLANLAEDRQRVRILRERADAAFPAPPSESIAAAIQQVACDKGKQGVQAVLDHLELDLVMTAHPTEAKRRTVRRTLARLRGILGEYDTHPSTRQKSLSETELMSELATLWQTDMIRDSRPTVEQEAQRSLSAKRAIWKTTAQLTQELRDAVESTGIVDADGIRPFIRLGSWVGGDRDGHPFVTHEVTRNTFQMLRREAIQLHLEKCNELIVSLSLSARHANFGRELADAISTAIRSNPSLEAVLADSPELELPRRWLSIVQQRLLATLSSSDELLTLGSKEENRTRRSEGLAYDSVSQFRDDIHLLLQSCTASCPRLAKSEIQPWLDQVDAFGFHLASLDIRQNSVEYTQAIGEIFTIAGWSNNWAELDSTDRQQCLLKYMNDKPSIDLTTLSEETQEVLNLFKLLRLVGTKLEPAAIGGHVISMTHTPADVLTVLWFWKWSGSAIDSNGSSYELPIIPLFETIEDLHHGASTLDEILSVGEYRDHLGRTGDRQTVMVGYSDSTKDGGYMAANWALYDGQQKLFAVAQKHGVRVVFFHGRGGSLGRGGGPAARAIRSLPSGTFQGAIRMTEQGEVLAERYDDPNIAHRHLEQLTWASILAAVPEPTDFSEFEATAEKLAVAAFKKYRELVEHEHFVQFFRTVTPISEIEQLQIGSRPSRRRGQSSLSDLRAIPWVFSWTQTRVMLPAWFGLGAAVRNLSRDNPTMLDQLRHAYTSWPYFRGMIDNAELALAKADMSVFRCYQELSESEEESIYLREIAAIIESECERSTETINKIKQQSKLLDGITWLAESIRVRNRYIDPLNFIQVELLGRLRRLDANADEAQINEAQQLTRIAIKGIAAGMRTTG